MLTTTTHRRLSLLESILGQPEGVLYLRRIIEGSFTLPLLMVGEQGTGRRRSVIEAAKAVFESSEHYALERGHHPDFRIIEEENGREIKVDPVRSMLEEAHVLPAWAPWKFFTIDGADRLTGAAANALLKVLEEPPEKVRFFLLCERIESVMPTIRSRCAVVSYRCLEEDLLLMKLREHTDDDVKALVCARMAEGSIGRALRILVSGQLTLRDEMLGILASVSRKDLFAAFTAVNDLTDLSAGLSYLGQILRDLMLLDVAPSAVTNVDAVEALKKLKVQLSEAVIRCLLSGLRIMRERAQPSLNVAFHVKALLAAACSEGAVVG